MPAADDRTPTAPVPLVSVIIPVYNAVDHLDECLESITSQSIGFEHVEIVAVDDGSTDGSGARLDDWATRHPNIRVLHQPNSGAPGAPRNRAVAEAVGEFLFFADPDDYLGTEALERLVAAARRDGADVVLGRIRGVGRSAAHIPFSENVAAGDIHSSKGVWSLTAHKLFRRSMVTEHRLRFAEGVRLAEEQAFIVPAYFHARAISVVADYDCYYLVLRDGFEHLTRQAVEPEPFYAQVRNALEVVAAHTRPGPEQDSLFRRWVQEELLGRFRGEFLQWPLGTQKRYMIEVAGILGDLIPDSTLAGFPPLDRLRARLLRQGALEELAQLARFEQAGRPDHAEIDRLPGSPRCLALRVATDLRLPDAPAGLRQTLLLRRTSDGREVTVPIEPADGTDSVFTFSSTVDLDRYGDAFRTPGRWQILLRLGLDDGTHDTPLRPDGAVGLGTAGSRRTRLTGGRLLTTRVVLDRRGEAVLDLAGPRALAGAARRAVERRVIRRTGRPRHSPAT
jgi:glycosyltransferase involved in cell wall biosynthesis